MTLTTTQTYHIAALHLALSFGLAVFGIFLHVT
jgi:hypothetical protein